MTCTVMEVYEGEHQSNILVYEFDHYYNERRDVFD